MDILMIGAGGIGGFLAAKLIPAGHRVFLLARGAHLEAIRRDGLKLIEGGGETVVQPAAISDDDIPGAHQHTRPAHHDSR